MRITLATLPQATEQEVFDQAAKHLLTQMKKSEDSDSCLYRGPNSIQCAAGCFIGDDEYQQAKFERVGWSSLVRDKKVPDAHSELIRMLQEIHDFAEPDFWRYKLQELALSKNLEWNF